MLGCKGASSGARGGGLDRGMWGPGGSGLGWTLPLGEMLVAWGLGLVNSADSSPSGKRVVQVQTKVKNASASTVPRDLEVCWKLLECCQT